MMELGFWLEMGYAGLFVVALVSATILPAATEAVMLTMLGLGFSLAGLLLAATFGNVTGACLNYAIGRKGVDFLEGSRFSPGKEKIATVQHWFERWGTPVLFFSWVPLLGDPLTIVAGLVRAPLRTFLFWVLLGRFLRYVGVLFVGDAVLNWAFF